MEEQKKDESFSPDVVKPRFLLRRYDSVSGSSDSSSRSSSSRGSFLQSPGRHHDQTSRRTRTNTFNGNCQTNGSEDSTSRTKHTNGRERSNGMTESNFSDEVCIFCDTLMNERQYYLWNSQYTKSSLCSRCSYDNDGMRYISFWGTPSYQSGSWRKRYNAGRGIDIDLSPLLEVLERIDQIDTSIDGRKSKRTDNKCNNSSDNSPNLDETKSKESYVLTERRRRRKANRSVIGDCNDWNNNIKKTNDHLDYSSPHQVSKENREHNKRTFTYSNSNTDQNVKEYYLTEMCTKTEDIDEIEPLLVINVTEQFPNQSTLHKEYIDSEHFKTLQGSKESITPSFNQDTMSAETLQVYRQKRRKSNYEEFLAGLDPMSQFNRRSSAAEDVKCYNESKTKKNTKTDRKTNSERKCQNTNESTILNSFENEKENKVEYKCQNNIHKREESTNVNGKKTRDHKSENNVRHIRPKYKYKLKRRNTPFMEDNTCLLNSEYLSGLKKLSLECEKKASNEKTERNIAIPLHTIERTDNSSCDEATFANIKQRFEKLSNGKTIVQSHNRIQSDIVPKGYFKSKYIESIEDVSNVSKREDNYDGIGNCVDNDDSNNARKSRQHNNVQCMKRNEYDQISENETFESSDFTDDSNVSDDQCKLIQDPNKYNNTAALNKKHESLDTTCNTNNIKEIDNLKLTGSRTEQHGVFHKENTDMQKPNLTNFTKENDEEESRKYDENGTKASENIVGEVSLSDSIERQFEEQNNSESMLKYSQDSDDDMLKSSICNLLNDDKSTNTVLFTEQTDRSTAARAREMKYRASEKDIEHENPNIERIKRKLSKKPKYENEDNSHSDEMNDMITELNGSDNEEIELGWRSRGYNTDFYMSRQSITGGEIIDRYKRALSNRRSKNNSRDASRRSSKSQNMSNMIDEVMTHSDPVSRNEHKSSKASKSAPLTRTNTQSFNAKETRPGTQVDYTIDDDDSGSGVSPIALQAALNRANNCSKRMTQRLKNQLSMQSDSDDSSS